LFTMSICTLVNEWIPSNNKKILKAEVVNNYIMIKYSDSKTIEIIEVNNDKYVFIIIIFQIKNHYLLNNNFFNLIIILYKSLFNI